MPGWGDLRWEMPNPCIQSADEPHQDSEESEEILSAVFPAMSLAAGQHTNLLTIHSAPDMPSDREKKKRFKKLLKMIYEVSGFHKATSDKNLKYLVWLLTGNSSTSYFKFYLLKYTRP